MTVCNIMRCACKGTKPCHQPFKAYEGGYMYYAAWYGPRFGDGSVCISLVPGEAARIAEESAAFDRDDKWAYCDDADHKNGPCDNYGCPYCDIQAGMESIVNVRDLFTARELKDRRRDLLAGKVVILHI